MISVVIQHKAIGGRMSRYASVRSLVAVNSIQTHAMAKILSAPGLTLPKTCILVGMPDWPTTVFTGVLRLPLLPVFVGSLPSLLLIAPTVLSAGSLLKADEGEYWETLSKVSLVVAALTQGGCVFGSLWFISKVVAKHKDELEAIPDDQAVLALEASALAKREVFEACTSWHDSEFPCVMRVILLVGSALMESSALMSAVLANECFVPFAVTDTVADKLSGSALNVLKPLGWVVVGLFFGGCVCMCIFHVWAVLRIGGLSAEQRQPKLQSAAQRKMASEGLTQDMKTTVTRRARAAAAMPMVASASGLWL
jgi:hypothetical protein